MRAASLEEVLALYDRWAGDPYDEVVTQLSHALQTAALAQAAGADDALVVAALFHDVGHLLALEAGLTNDRDLRHEARGSAYLAPLFRPAVTAPIALHVQAKRHLCATDPGYEAVLSAGSVDSLRRQGGAFTPAEQAAFAVRPGHADAVALRRWDDAAKELDADVPDLWSYERILRQLLR
jgi:gamma-butyrobetaine dioxygenase